MNFRHAAMLALAGWYLMMPPMGSVESRRNPSTGFYVAYSTQPLNTWEIAGSYDTAAECRNGSRASQSTSEAGLPRLLCGCHVHRSRRSAPEIKRSFAVRVPGNTVA